MKIHSSILIFVVLPTTAFSVLLASFILFVNNGVSLVHVDERTIWQLAYLRNHIDYHYTFSGSQLSCPHRSPDMPISWRAQILLSAYHIDVVSLDKREIYDMYNIECGDYRALLHKLSVSQFAENVFKIHGLTNTKSCYIMIPPTVPDQYPVIVGVKKVSFDWIDCGDCDFWHLLVDSPYESKLYEVRNDRFVFCEVNDLFVPVLAPDKGIYLVPVTTDVGIFKKIVDATKFKSLQKIKQGHITSFH